MSRHSRRLRRIRALAVALCAAALALPAGAQAMPDLRGEFAKSQTQRGLDARSEWAKGPSAAPALAPSEAIDPTDGADQLPYVVSGAFLAFGLALIAIAVPFTRRRVRVS